MRKDIIISSATPGLKIAYLFILLIIGVFIAGVFAGLILIIPCFNNAGEAASIYINSACSSVFALALPAYLIAALSGSKPMRYLKINGSKRMSRILIFATLLFIVSYACSSFLAQWNKGVVLPEWLSGVEDTMRAMEDAAMETTNLLLSGKTIGSLITNLIVVAGFAAISEEMFFRGALQQIINEKFKNGHVAVWISALVFSIVHFQFYGFIPRLFLGALLGYLFLYTKNLWAPILFHFLNNASVIAVNFFWSDTEWYSKIESAEITFWYAFLAIISLVFTITLLYTYNNQNNKANKYG